MKFHVRKIRWDKRLMDGKGADASIGELGPEPDLPVDAWVNCDTEDDIATALSDAYGWLVDGYEVVAVRGEVETPQGEIGSDAGGADFLFPYSDARFIHLGDARDLVVYVRTVGELFERLEKQELAELEVRRPLLDADMEEHEYRTELGVIEHQAAKRRLFLGTHAVLHAHALIEGMMKAGSDFVGQMKGLIEADGVGPRLGSRETWPDEFRKVQGGSPVARWQKWYAVVMDYPLPLTKMQVERIEVLTHLRNALGHELTTEPGAEAFWMERAAQSLEPHLLHLVEGMAPDEVFGRPPGAAWALLAEGVAQTLIEHFRRGFPTPTQTGIHLPFRPPLRTP